MDPLPPSLPNAGPPQPVPAGQVGLAILLAELTQALAKLPAGAQIPALVTQILPQLPAPPQQQAPAPGQASPAPSLVLQLSTPDGPAQVKVPATVQIPVGARLEITVATAGPQPQWRLASIDGKPVSPSPVAVPAPAAAPLEAAPRPAPAPGISATVVKAADPALPSGTTLLVRITGLVPPAPQEIPAEPDPVPEAEAEAEPGENPAAPPTPMAPAPLPTAQAPIPTTAPSVTAAPAPTALAAPAPTPAASPPAPAAISGEILPNTDAGRPLLKTPVGLLALSVEPQSAPPAGTQVTLAVIGKPVPPAAPLPLPPPPDDPPDIALPRRLAQWVEQVQANGDPKLAEAVRQAIPAPGPKLAAQLLSVIASSAAEPRQAVPRWLGDGLAAALTHSAPEAAAQLSRQWEAISQPAQGPDNGDWRTLLVPLMMGGQMNLVRLTTRRRPRGATPAEREKGTRFLLDLDLSRLGPMQFDGLVKRQHKRFDLIIRTREPLPGEMRRDIDGLFLNGLVTFGLQGSVAFQPDGRFVATAPLTGDANGIIFA